MYDDILLPYDGSEGAAGVLDHAADIAQWAGATIHVLYVADSARHSVTVIEGEAVDALVRQGEGIVADAADALQSRAVSHETEVRQGDPAQTIASYAERYGLDLVVMPTHAREGISRYLIGSVTEKVVRLSSVPVLTARMDPEEHLVFPYEDILLPTDGSEGAAVASEHGLALAAALDATVHGLSVVEDAPVGPDVRSLTSRAAGEEAAEAALDDLAARAAEVGVDDVVRYVMEGRPVEGILSCVEDNEVDAVVMGTTGRQGTDRILLGSVAEKSVRSVPVPVFTVGE